MKELVCISFWLGYMQLSKNVFAILLWDGQNIMSLVNLILKWRMILLIPGLMLPLRFVASLCVE